MTLTARPPDISRLLATRLIGELGDRPLRLTADQLAWVWGRDLVTGESPASRARIAAGRYAALFADHVVQDVTIAGAPGAYARILMCARLAFLESATSESSERSAGGEMLAWENEGGAAATVRSSA